MSTAKEIGLMFTSVYSSAISHSLSVSSCSVFVSSCHTFRMVDRYPQSCAERNREVYSTIPPIRLKYGWLIWVNQTLGEREAYLTASRFSLGSFLVLLKIHHRVFASTCRATHALCTPIQKRDFSSRPAPNSETPTPKLPRLPLSNSKVSFP